MSPLLGGPRSSGARFIEPPEPPVPTPLIAVYVNIEVMLCSVDRIDSLSQHNCDHRWQPRIVNARHFKRIDWAQESVLLVIMSTAGDGEGKFDC